MGQGFCNTCAKDEHSLEQDYSQQNNLNENLKVRGGVTPDSTLNEGQGKNNFQSFSNVNNQNFQSENGKRVEIIEYEDGSVYTGEVFNQKKCGFGVLQNSKQFYEGEFDNDLFSGFGYIENVKKIAYMGEFVNNLKSGIGVQFSLADSYVYEGEWKNNLKNGIGREILPDNSEYIGEFVNGKKHGKGVYMMANGRRYEGEFKNSKIDGYGYLLCDNGDYFNGFWEDNEYNGFGVLSKKDSLFKGFFKKDKKHGYGIKYSTKAKNNENVKAEDTDIKTQNTTIILVGNWVENSLEGLALGINPSSYKVEKIYKFTANKLKSSTDDIEIIKEKTISNRECTNLLNFYVEYRDRD